MGCAFKVLPDFAVELIQFFEGFLPLAWLQVLYFIRPLLGFCPDLFNELLHKMVEVPHLSTLFQDF